MVGSGGAADLLETPTQKVPVEEAPAPRHHVPMEEAPSTRHDHVEEAPSSLHVHVEEAPSSLHDDVEEAPSNLHDGAYTLYEGEAPGTCAGVLIVTCLKPGACQNLTLPSHAGC